MINDIIANVPHDVITEKEFCFKNFDTISRATNSCLFVIDFANEKLVYISERLPFLGSDHHTSQFGSLTPYWSVMTNESKAVLKGIKHAYYMLFDSMSIEQRQTHILVTDYAILVNHREYIITQKFTPLQLWKDGKLWLGLFTITFSPNESNSKKIVVFGDSFGYIFDHEKQLFEPCLQDYALTEIEIDILLRAAKGMTTESIADELCRSVNTIKTHRNRLFKKLNVETMAEAIIKASNYHLI